MGYTKTHELCFADMLRSIVRSAGKSYARASREIGRSSGFIGNALCEKKPLRADTLAAICEACGYELIVRGHDKEYVLTIDGPTVAIEERPFKHRWHATPAITNEASRGPQTTVLEDDCGTRLLVDYRLLREL